MNQRNDQQRSNEPYQQSGSRSDERDEHRQGFHPGNPGFHEPPRHSDPGAPEQYGQEHYWRDRAGQGPYGQEHYGRDPYGRPPYGRQQYGQDQYGRNQYDREQSGRQPFGREQDSREDYGREAYGRGQSWAQQGRGPRYAQYPRPVFSESREPHYFGTGWQGYGGGPSFTGGTYGHADWRSESPYFEEAGINRGYYQEAPEPSGARGWDQRAGSRSARRYPQGPKGYQRSDERLREDISERLMHSHHIDSSDVTVQVAGGKVLLEGTVPDRYMKHAIEDICDAAPGVQDIDNRLRVQRAEFTPSPAAASSASAQSSSLPGSGTSAAGSGGARARKDS